MNVNDIFYRRDTIVESLDLDYLPLTEGIGSSIKDSFIRIKNVIVNFFNNLIKKFKEIFKKKYKLDKLMKKEELKKKASSSNIPIEPSIRELKPLEKALDFQRYIIEDFPKNVCDKYENLPFENYKTKVNEALKKYGDINKYAENNFFTGVKINYMNKVNFYIIYDYIFEFRDVSTALEKTKKSVIFNINNSEKIAQEFVNEGRLEQNKVADIVSKAKYGCNIQLKVVNATYNTFNQIVDAMYSFLLWCAKKVK